MGNLQNLKAAGLKRKTKILAAFIISTVYAAIGISFTAQAAQTLPVKYIVTDIVPVKYRNFILDMSDYPLSNATMESGAWKYVKAGNTITAPDNTNIGAGTGKSSALDMIPCKANASLFAPSVGTWIDGNGKKRDIDLTMYATSYNGGDLGLVRQEERPIVHGRFRDEKHGIRRCMQHGRERKLQHHAEMRLHVPRHEGKGTF